MSYIYETLSSPGWEGKVRIVLGYPRHGWVLLAFLTTASHQHIVVDCSDVFCPFPDIKKWLEQIERGQLPAKLLIDEEGCFKSLLALPWEGNNEILWLCITDDPDWEGENMQTTEIPFKCRIDRKHFVADFAGEVIRWIREDWRPELYAKDDGPAYFTKMDFESFLRRDASTQSGEGDNQR